MAIKAEHVKYTQVATQENSLIHLSSTFRTDFISTLNKFMWRVGRALQLIGKNRLTLLNVSYFKPCPDF